jgi:hypothetical protein
MKKNKKIPLTMMDHHIASERRKRKFKRKMIILLAWSIFLLIFILFIGCSDDPGMIQVGEMHDYYFENDIEVNSVDETREFVHNYMTNKDEKNDYWQLPEESYNSKTGDCEDYCIFFQYLLYEKINLNSELVLIKNQEGDRHTLVEVEGFYHEIINNFKSAHLQSGWETIWKASYFKVVWMTYYYHDNVGKYR